MKRGLVAFSALLAFVGFGTPRADAGPVKHWETFPGREVRAVSLRGNAMGSEPGYAVVQGRDGHVYIRGRYGLYRVLDDDGANVQIADTVECGGPIESQGADTRSLVPRAICDRGAVIILVSATSHKHLQAALPRWTGPARPTRGDNRYLTSVIPADGGGYWFAFGAVHGVGHSWPSGRSEVRYVPNVDEIAAIAAAGSRLYFIDTSCRVGRWNGLSPVLLERLPCTPNAYAATVVATRDGAVWALSGTNTSGVAVRYGADGSRRHWKLPMSATGVAVARDGTTYILGTLQTASIFNAAIAVIPPSGKLDIRSLPMQDTGTLAIDGHDRIWITAPFEHGAALIAPKGTWR
jgi:hypothetical protein